MKLKWQRYSSTICSLMAILAITSMVLSTTMRRGTSEPATAEITNWGLSFQQEGAPPVGNANAEFLADYQSVYYVPTEEKVIYLTFDAGFENGHMPQILDVLKKHNVTATFFLVGHYLEQEGDLVKRMHAEGHTVGNHTYSHPDMSAIADSESFQKELQQCETLYQNLTGEPMSALYRPPQGKFSQSNLEMAKSLGYSTVFWSLAYVDWYQDQQPSQEEAFSKLIPRIHPGAVVLLHSTSATNAAILDDLLTQWEALGYSFGDLESYLQSMETDPIHSSLSRRSGS